MSKAIADAIRNLETLSDEADNLRSEADELADRLDNGADKALRALAEVEDELNDAESRAERAEARVLELEETLDKVRKWAADADWLGTPASKASLLAILDGKADP